MVDRSGRRRKFLIALGAGALLPCTSFAQQGKVWRVGFLAARSRSTAANPDLYYDAFVQEMRERGYMEGKNLVIEWRFADSDYERLPSLAAELVRLKVHVLVTHGTAATRALHRATSTIPIVSTSVADPVAGGFAASLARPGGNVTGTSAISIDATAKQFELLTTMLPKLARVAVLLNLGNPAGPSELKMVQDAAQRTGIKVVTIDARTPEGIERGFAAMLQARAEAVVVVNDAIFLGQWRKIGELSVRNRLPSMAPYREIAEAGGLMSYGQDFAGNYRHAAAYVDKILKGAKPGDLPFEQPTRFELVINRKTAKALGLSIPAELLLRADKLID
jgi:putative ABC transport system substrate-binding protein